MPEYISRGEWGVNDKGQPWFNYDDIPQERASSAYIAGLKTDPHMPTKAFDLWFKKNMINMYSDGLWDQIRIYHSTDRNRIQNITLPLKYHEAIQAFVDVYGVRYIDWVQHLIHQLHYKSHLSSAAKILQKRKNKNK